MKVGDDSNVLIL